MKADEFGEIGPLIGWADYPKIEAELLALDLIDHAMKRLESVNAPACDQLHCVKVEIERHLGEAMFRIGRELRKAAHSGSHQAGEHMIDRLRCALRGKHKWAGTLTHVRHDSYLTCTVCDTKFWVHKT